MVAVRIVLAIPLLLGALLLLLLAVFLPKISGTEMAVMYGLAFVFGKVGLNLLIREREVFSTFELWVASVGFLAAGIAIIWLGGVSGLGRKAGIFPGLGIACAIA